MGPATAVLVLPTLQWIDTPPVMNQIFNDTGAAYQPNRDQIFPHYNTTQLVTQDYSCTLYPYGFSLDAWVSQLMALFQQMVAYPYTRDSDGGPGISQEADLHFTLNKSEINELVWIPNRQVLREMSHELFKLFETQEPLTSSDLPAVPYQVFNNSLRTLLQRNGPCLGVHGHINRGNVSNLLSSDGRWIRCHTGFQLTVDGPAYTQCLRLHTNYDDSSFFSQFWIENLDKSVSDEKTVVEVYFADRATYFNDTEYFGQDIDSCLLNDTSTPCDWGRVFDSATLPPELKNCSVNISMISFQVPGAPNSRVRVFWTFFTYLSFARYTLDTSVENSLIRLVSLNDVVTLGNDTLPLVIHPDWFLAALSADINATLDGNRPIVKELTRGISAYYYNTSQEGIMSLASVEISILTQALSIVDYSYHSNSTDPNSKEAKEAEKSHHLFHTWGTIHVWAYGLSGRTSYLGVAVVLLGSMYVLASFFLGLLSGIGERSTVKILASAFKHHHQGEFEDLEEESHLARVRYQIVEDEEQRVRYIPEQRYKRADKV
ncbi:MAG: hypothetical protein Q9214_007066 [Letrouitia sp. 1 TL-2023]